MGMCILSSLPRGSLSFLGELIAQSWGKPEVWNHDKGCRRRHEGPRYCHSSSGRLPKCLLSICTIVVSPPSPASSMAFIPTLHPASEASSADEVLDEDARNLESFGYKQELKRDFSFFGMLGFAWSVLTTWTALGGSLVAAINAGGPPVVVYSWIAVSFFSCSWPTRSPRSVVPSPSLAANTLGSPSCRLRSGPD
ncbi:hypothetical protein MRB53_041110 [Persea americana]|nr:hypothetical protein MRB53_041110 [Persea americana]